MNPHCYFATGDIDQEQRLHMSELHTTQGQKFSRRLNSACEISTS